MNNADEASDTSSTASWETALEMLEDEDTAQMDPPEGRFGSANSSMPGRNTSSLEEEAPEEGWEKWLCGDLPGEGGGESRKVSSPPQSPIVARASLFSRYLPPSPVNHSSSPILAPLPRHPNPFPQVLSTTSLPCGQKPLEEYLQSLREAQEAIGTDVRQALAIDDWRDTRSSVSQPLIPKFGEPGWITSSLRTPSPIGTPVDSSTPLRHKDTLSETTSSPETRIPADGTFSGFASPKPTSPPQWWPSPVLEPSSPTSSVLLGEHLEHLGQPHQTLSVSTVFNKSSMSVYTSNQPLITFSGLKGELISEIFEAIETEEELRVEALDIENDASKKKAAVARGLTLKKLRLRQSLTGKALEYFLALSPELRSDYEKAKKALSRRFGDQSNTTSQQREDEAKWAAISRMTALKQNGRSYKEYILELEALSDVLTEDELKRKLIEVWLKGFDDERDGRTMRLVAQQETATTPDSVAAAARKFFFTDADRAWIPQQPARQVEVPVFAVQYAQTGSYPPPQQQVYQPSQQASTAQPDLLETLRLLASSVASLQLNQVGSPQNTQRPTYRAPNHQRAPSDSQVHYQNAPVSYQNNFQSPDQMMCFNCKNLGHKAQHCPQYNPRRDGPQPQPQQMGYQAPAAYPKPREQSAPPTSRDQPRNISAANSVDIAPPRIVEVQDDLQSTTFPPIHVERTFQVPASQAYDVALVDVSGEYEVASVSSVQIAQALMADAAKRPLDQEESNKRPKVMYDPARDAPRPVLQPRSQIPKVTGSNAREHFLNLLKDPEFEKQFVDAATEKARNDAAKARAAKKQNRKSRHEFPPIRALTDPDSKWALALKLLRHVKFGIAHPGVSEAIFSLADVLNNSPRTRAHWTALMQSSEPKKRGRQATVSDDDGNNAVFGALYVALVECATELATADAGLVDCWLADEESVHMPHLFYTYGMLDVQGTWKTLGAMLIDGGALLSLIPMSVVQALDAVPLLKPVTGMSYKTAAGSIHSIKWKFQTTLKIGPCQARVTLFVTSADAPYGILLSRRFMAQSKMRGDYQTDTYTMGTRTGVRVKVPKHNPVLTRPVTQQDIPVLVNLEDPPLSGLPYSMPPPAQDKDVYDVSNDQSRTLILEAVRTLFAKMSNDEPLFSDSDDDDFSDEEDDEDDEPAGKA
ncbi:hypothetical protein BJ508DRAFT_328202 [Ascobolus immersus RN42]|uniref:CCHC-type domain-containing protein n=1 Tax=Ascobolus immersus RN42 TaxID=1160509 RepID=A0A3N4I2J0_ASCIM|nr:hypothetical protein BJ508DRAFT_328202 [Ascobolus immersus RN42]